MDQEEQINLPAIMIRHITKIANTTREHDLGYGFLLTQVFEHFKVVSHWLRGLFPNREQKHPFLLFLGVPQVDHLLKLHCKINHG